ncbi:MAG: serine hydrolase family protein [Candidatus Aenigmarchaeota archaeon]|nr:serine hydrolase family protein [Candidatus Aenigmarchaeota archaeon]
MANAIIIHGSWGSPQENWFPWLKAELGKLGYAVQVPQFPTPGGQRLDNWLDVLAGLDRHIGPATIMIAHSIGCALLLHKLELLKRSVKAIFLVGGFTKDLWAGRYKDIVDSFFARPFDWAKIRQNAGHGEVFQSDNDPYVPIAVGTQLAASLAAKLVVVKGAGHFNRQSGYTSFPLLLERITAI